jgi:initiation factor 1A
MPKNKKGGKQFKKGKKNLPPAQLILKTDKESDYAIVVKANGGNCLVDVIGNDSYKNVFAQIRGSIRRTKILSGDIVLVGFRNFITGDTKIVDIIVKYSLDQINQLKIKGEISNDIKVNDNKDNVIFCNDIDSDEDIPTIRTKAEKTKTIKSKAVKNKSSSSSSSDETSDEDEDDNTIKTKVINTDDKKIVYTKIKSDDTNNKESFNFDDI